MERNESASLSEARKNLSEKVERFVEVFWEFARKVATAVFEWFKGKVKPIIQFAKNYERKILRHKHNQHTRSTWSVEWDTRKRHQQTNRRPMIAVRKVPR